MCRHAEPTFEVDGPISIPATTLGSARLDADGQAQAIGTGGGTVGVLRDNGTYQVSLLRVGDPSLSAARSLDGGPRGSLLTLDDGAIVGWNTSSDGDFQPLLTIERTPDDLDPTTPALDVPEPGVRVVPLRTDLSPAHPIAFFALQAASGLLLGTLTPPIATRLAAVTGTLAQLVPHLAIGNIDILPASPGDEVAFGFVPDAAGNGGDTVWVARTTSVSCTQAQGCSACVGSRCELDTPTVTATIAVPASGGRSAIGDRLLFGNVDNDVVGKPDLLIELYDGNVAVAYGDGGGGFGPAAIDARFTPPDPGGLAVPPCSAMATPSAAVQNPPLIALDLDNDNVTDYVTADGIILGRGADIAARRSARRPRLRSRSMPTATAGSTSRSSTEVSCSSTANHPTERSISDIPSAYPACLTRPASRSPTSTVTISTTSSFTQGASSGSTNPSSGSRTADPMSAIWSLPLVPTLAPRRRSLQASSNASWGALAAW